MRVMTWNVRSLRDDRTEVVRVVQAVAPDVLLLQEAPRFLRSRSRLAALARDTGLVFVCGGRASAGTALLTSLRVDVLATQEVRFPKLHGLHQRGLAAASLRLGSLAIAAGSVHLGLDSAERVTHAGLVRTALADLAQPFELVAGDVNEPEGGTAWRILASALTDAATATGTAAPTFPARSPRVRIDVVLVGPALEVAPVPLPDGDLARASDHLPVVVDIAVA